jgi:hypothetical protein
MFLRVLLGALGLMVLIVVTVVLVNHLSPDDETTDDGGDLFDMLVQADVLDDEEMVTEKLQ